MAIDDVSVYDFKYPITLTVPHLLTIPAERQAELSAVVVDKIGTNLTVIGSITDKPGPIEYTLDGRVFDYGNRQGQSQITQITMA